MGRPWQSVSVLAALARNGNLRRVELAWGASIAAEWTHFVALGVFAYNAGGASAVGIAGLVRTYQPEEGSAKTFCSVCGSNLFGSGWPNSEFTSVRLSAIVTPFEKRPDGHIYVRSLAAWETLPDDGLERFEAGRR